MKGRANADEVAKLASEYRTSVRAASRAGVSADPEAQLTTPTDILLSALARLSGIGTLRFIREQQLVDSRPDFGVLKSNRFCGWVELKKPDTDISDPSSWTGRNGVQWKKLSLLENVLLSNGREMRRFVLGEPIGETAQLPYHAEAWNADPAVKILRQFSEAAVMPVKAVSVLARRLAPLARDLRERVIYQLVNRSADGHIATERAHDAWCAYFQEKATGEQFADGVAQVVTYGLVIAALEGSADGDDDGLVTLAEARSALHGKHKLLSAALAPVMEVDGFFQHISIEVAAIERLVSAIDEEALREKPDSRGEPWLWFYEDFLATYDPDARKKTGVYYTPLQVVGAMTRFTEDILVNRFDLRLGFGDPKVTTLDPACGTGTFPLAVIDAAAKRLRHERGPAGPAQAATTLANTLFGFELLPGPYAVAHLRIAERLRELDGTIPDDGVNILLTDSLASPTDDTGPQLTLFGDAAVLADERRKAQRVQREQEIRVILGNPPYRRVDRKSEGGWVVHGDSKTVSDKALFSTVVSRANEHTGFGHRRSLYNLYTYFWRWAIWKTFEAHGSGPGVVGFITGSKWISGAGFIGLRELALKHADDIYVIDLGGDNRSGLPEENIFAIESPVSIVFMVRDDKSDGSRNAQVHYSRIEGTKEEKFATLDKAEGPSSVSWQTVTLDQHRSFVPPSGHASWLDLPLVADLFPWQQGGCLTSRLWPIAPDPSVLERRWAELLSDTSPGVRADKYQTANHGRNIHTAVGDLPRLVGLPANAGIAKISRYGWRSFDRHWIIEDPRLLRTESPSLWQSRSDSQIFLAVPGKESIGPGPTATISIDVPDYHFVRGRGGNDILPLYRDAEAVVPNITDGLREYLAVEIGVTEGVTPESLLAYVYAILSTPNFQSMFAEELVTPGVRVPITRSLALWEKAVAQGEQLVWLHTFGGRFRNEENGRGSRIPSVQGLGWQVSVTKIPESMDEIRYDEKNELLHVGDGRVSGVRSDVWEYSVTGMQVVSKWLGWRTRTGSGKAATNPKPLDYIRPVKWLDEWNDELLDLLRVLTLTIDQMPEQDELLEEICANDLISTRELPVADAKQTKTPKTDSNYGRLRLDA